MNDKIGLARRQQSLYKLRNVFLATVWQNSFKSIREEVFLFEKFLDRSILRQFSRALFLARAEKDEKRIFKEGEEFSTTNSEF